MEWIRVLAAFVGLGAVLAFAQSMRLGYSGPIGKVGGFLFLPAAVLCLVLLAIDFGWWTMGILVLVSLAVGVINGAYIRTAGSPAALLAMQPMFVACFVLATAIGWAARYAR